MQKKKMRQLNIQSGPSDPNLKGASLNPGEIILERYQIVHLIQAGGMGEVYRAVDTAIGNEVALKIAHMSVMASPQAHSMFKAEGEVLSAIAHDNVVGYVESGLDSKFGRACIVMDLVEGVSLEKRIHQEPLNENELRELLVAVTRALIVIHSAGIAHLDLSPSNIQLVGGEAGTPMLVDFGVSGQNQRASDLGKGKFAGTLDFISPEQLGMFAGPVDGRADIFSLGLIAVACCRGETLPMGGTAEEAVAARTAKLDVSDIYPSLQRVIQKMISTNPIDRQSSGNQLLEELLSSGESDRLGLGVDLPSAKNWRPAKVQSSNTVLGDLPVIPQQKH